MTHLDVCEMAGSNNDAARLFSELNLLHSREVRLLKLQKYD